MRRNSPPSRPIDSGKFWRTSRHAAGDRSWPNAVAELCLAGTASSANQVSADATPRHCEFSPCEGFPMPARRLRGRESWVGVGKPSQQRSIRDRGGNYPVTADSGAK